VDALLDLQGGVEGDEAALADHEVLFIVVHQVYELWFKLVLRELTTARDLMRADPVPDQELSRLVAALRRIARIFELATDHFRLMETLTTRDFLDFRDKLLPASGFQSAQMREIEILLGLDESERLHLGWEGSYLDMLRGPHGEETSALRRVMARIADRPTFRTVVGEWLWRTPIRGSSPSDAGDPGVVEAFVEDYLASHRRELAATSARSAASANGEEKRAQIRARYEAEAASAQAFLTAQDVPGEERERRQRIRAALVFIESYRELPLLAWPREVVDSLVALEQGFLIFRQRHARMVEREIGRRVGTGGSAGVDYLDQTARTYRVFRDVWAVRTILVRRDAVPELEEGGFYDFRFTSG
jgi:tryptophan 2,3-dioxygenase